MKIHFHTVKEGLIWVMQASVLSCFSSVQLFATPWMVTCQAPLSMGFSRQESWSGLPCPPPGDLPDPDISSVQFSSVAQACPTLCDPMNCSTPGFPVHHQLSELAQTHVHWVRDAIQPSHPLLPSSPFAFNLSQHQGLLQWVSSLHQVARVLEIQLQSFQWIFRVDFL